MVKTGRSRKTRSVSLTMLERLRTRDARVSEIDGGLIMLRRSVMGALLFICLLPALVAAQVPSVMPFQGRLTDNAGAVIPANSTVIFQIFSVPSGGTPLWGPETHTVTPTNGIVSVFLGAGDTPLPITASVFSSPDRYLQITVNGQIMSPRIRIGTTGFAFMAQTVPDNAITSAKIAASAVGTAQIADGAATVAKVSGMPGVDWTTISATNINVRTSAVNVGTVAITAPTAGYVVVRFDGMAFASTGDRLVLAASNASGGWGVNDGHVEFLGDGLAHPFSHTRVYAVAGGTPYTFYAVAQNLIDVGGTGLASIYAQLTVEFFPTRY